MTFDEWALRQFGPRPTSITIGRLVQQAREHEEAAARIRAQIAEVREWEERQSGARVAWNFRDKARR